MLRKLLPVFAAFFAVALAAAPLPFPQDGSDLKPDPAARFGTLPNGLRYAILPNHEPKNRASLRLLVLTGSLEENENQRGLAHFLEHMAFNGSAHYAPGTLVEYFQRLGMSFGGDTNAYTSFDHTAYQIELPDTKPATVTQGLQVFADFAGTLLLKPDQVKKERPIILAEKRTRDSVDYRDFVAEFEFLLGGTRLPERLPIGEQKIIEETQRDRFVDLYNTWYRPERMVVLVVGEIDPAAVEKQIIAAFSGVADRAPARPLPDLGKIQVLDGFRAGYHAEPEAPATKVSIEILTPYAFEPDTAAKRLHYLPRDLAFAILNRRLDILSKKENAPFTRGSATVHEDFQFYHNASIDLTCKPEQWSAALTLAEQELRRALKFGFTPAELKEVIANFTNDLEQAAQTASTRRSDQLASDFLDSFVDREVFTSPADDLALFQPALEKITADDCLGALREAWAAPGRYVFIDGNAKIPGDAVAAITKEYQTSAAVAVEPPAAESNEKFAYTDFGPAGKITEQKHIDDLDLTLVTFANGVRVNLKKTDFEANQIRLSVRLGAGELIEPRDQPGLAFFTDLTFTAGGLGQHSVDDLQRLLAGRTVGLDFKVGGDALNFAGTTNREDLLLQLQLLAAYLTDPGYRPEALRLARKNIDEMYNELAHVPEGPLRTEVPNLLASGDPRFGLPARDVTLARTVDQEKAWLAPQLGAGPIEIGIAGDIDLSATLDALAHTFGALPARTPKPAYENERKVSFPAETFTKDYHVPTKIPKAVVSLYWPTTDARDIHLTRRLGLLAEVLDDRLRVKIREQIGGSYSPEVASEPSETFTHYGYMVAEAIVDPARSDEITKAILAVAADLQKNGVTADELERAKKPLLTALRDSARTNQYWLTAVLASCQEFPQRLDWCRTRYSDFDSITQADLNDLAKTYLASDKAFQVIVQPEIQKP
ncbi:MAG TPA: insulinase family protein [Opitutaceae bacterium]|jgi:zinc protease|nr:insulinase family protein [Opitutaceae bacterium]